ncbi:uncharacterized protein N7498_001467 [Penicillium cinerascens]|uniref:Rhodopsin domain-containing protein n=1 Tax=Penicillium cinerascens TaxID=70096 RepID=A0A9W9NIR6_9EURO|nr:uncharacterized protein N7498_001467 [Penicillium cinerascens]KAJ5219368.1 hypothetical protein N7498_001467 [Penicillium cinerascens]
MSLLALRNASIITDENTDPRESAHWSAKNTLAIAIVFMVVATIAFLLRLYSRQKTVWRVALEDVLIGIGLTFSYLLSACVIIGVLDRVKVLGPLSFVREAIYYLPERRLLHVSGNWQKVTTGLMVFTTAWGITSIIGNALQYLPPRYFWPRDIDGHCPDDQEAFTVVIGSLALAEDVILLIIPIIVVWQLKLVRAEKIRITILFSFGRLSKVCIFGILRVSELVNYHAENLTASGAFEVTWAVLEINLGIRRLSQGKASLYSGS